MEQAEKEILDHPLANNKGSQWKMWHDDKVLWEEIDKDVKRTRCELAFFYTAVDPSRNSSEDFHRLEMQARTKKCDMSGEDAAAYIESHLDALARVLFIFAKLNKGIRYI